MIGENKWQGSNLLHNQDLSSGALDSEAMTIRYHPNLVQIREVPQSLSRDSMRNSASRTPDTGASLNLQQFDGLLGTCADGLSLPPHHES